jgi:hypothetical protein
MASRAAMMRSGFGASDMRNSFAGNSSEPVLYGWRREGFVRLAGRAVAIREITHRGRDLRVSAARRGKGDSTVITAERRRDSRAAISRRAECGRISRRSHSGAQLPAAAGSADLAAVALPRLGAAVVLVVAPEALAAGVVGTASAGVVGTASAAVAGTASAAVAGTASAAVAADTEVIGRRLRANDAQLDQSGPGRRHDVFDFQGIAQTLRTNPSLLAQARHLQRGPCAQGHTDARLPSPAPPPSN